MSDASATTERRTRAELRSLFPAACAALRPFFDPANRWQGQSHEQLAYRSVKAQFPELSAQDSFVLVGTVKRLFATGKFPTTP